jgi:hypothetical protein
VSTSAGSIGAASAAASAAAPSASSRGPVQVASATGAAAALGTCPSDTYSAKRAADNRSDVQASRARKARPEGLGRRVPRLK